MSLKSKFFFKPEQAMKTSFLQFAIKKLITLAECFPLRSNSCKNHVLLPLV